MNYHNITKQDMLNGEGFRTVLWTAGCEHHCEECQNPLTWDKCGGLVFDDEAKREVLESLSDEITSGLTLSGGDPLATFNRADILELVKEVKDKYPDKDIWSYTGYTYEQLLEDETASEILKYIDVLVDGRYMKDLRDVSLNWRGSSNQRLIDVPKSLVAGKVILFGQNENQLYEGQMTCECGC